MKQQRYRENQGKILIVPGTGCRSAPSREIYKTHATNAWSIGSRFIFLLRVLLLTPLISPLCNLRNGPIANDHSQHESHYGAYAELHILNRIS
jgi:hypothetical protein